MDSPLVSVIIPVYNGEGFLAEALDSVFAQTYRPIEVIVVDDGSTDGSAAVARGYPDVQIICQENGGAGAARNAGLSRASGDFIAFLDADDTSRQEKLRLQVGHLVSDPNCLMVLAHLEHFLEPGAARPAWLRADRLGAPEPSFLPSAWLLRRRAFDIVGGFDTAYRVAEDADWMIRAKDAGIRAFVLDEVLVLKRVHTTNLTSNIEAAQKSLLSSLRTSLTRQRSENAAEGG